MRPTLAAKTRQIILWLVYFLFVIVCGCQYQCNQLPEKTRLSNDRLCVEWDIKPYTLTHPLIAQWCWWVQRWCWWCRDMLSSSDRRKLWTRPSYTRMILIITAVQGGPRKLDCFRNIKNWTFWHIECYSISTYTGVTNWQKVRFFLAHPVV